MNIQDEAQVNHANGLATSFQSLTDNLFTLFRQHIELVRYEVKQEATFVGKNIAALVLFGVIALVGYVFLNLAIVVFAAWLGGIVAMAIATLALALLHLGVAAVAIWRIQSRFQEQSVSLSRTSEEIQKDKEWIKQIRTNSQEAPRALNS